MIDARQGEEPESVVHVPEPGAPVLAVGDAVTAELDWDRRYAHMRLHTALHVLSCVVVAPVTGGNIAADKGRLDFDIDMSRLDAARIERELNAFSNAPWRPKPSGSPTRNWTPSPSWSRP